MKTSLEEIKAKIGSDPRWAMRAVVVLYGWQTTEEQKTDHTGEENGAGFNKIDAEILSSFARQVIAGRRLSERQLAIAFKKLPKYAGQLYRSIPAEVKA